MKSKILALFGLPLVVCISAHGANLTWDIAPGSVGAGDAAITGGTGTWDITNGNWTTDAGVTNIAWNNTTNAADTAIFQGTGGTVTLGAPITAGNITFSTADYVISGGTITLTGTPTLTTTAAGTISSVIAGSAGLLKAGTAALTLNGVNTFTGSLRPNAGTVTLGVDHALASTAAIAYNGNSSSTLALGSTIQQVATFTHGPTAATNLTVTGTAPASLLVQGTTDMTVSNNNTSASGTSTLDMSGVSSFTYNSPANKVVIGNTQNARSTALTLGASSTFTAASFELQNQAAGGNTAKNSTVNLGQSTTINANTIYVLAANARDNATMQFRPLTTPTLKIRATDTTSRANWNLATSIGATSTTNAALVDLTTNVTDGSQLDALLGTLQIGQKTSTGVVSATFRMGGGLLDATTINVGNLTGAGTLNSTLTATGGTVTAGTLTLGTQSAGTLTSIVNLNGGATLNAQTIQNGGGTATRTFNWNDGTIKNYDGSTNLAVSSTLTLANTGTHSFNIGSGRAGTISGVLKDGASPGGTLTKDGAGTLTLGGINTYTGPTVINAGTLELGSTGSLKFIVDFVTTRISGTGTATFDGTFNLDLNAVRAGDSGSWTLVDMTTLASATYGSNFTIAGFTKSGTTWTLLEGPKHWVFEQTTGVLTLSTQAANLSWAGTVDGGVWDINGAANWLNGATPSAYAGADDANFDDSAAGTTNVVLNATVSPQFVNFYNNDKTYTLTGTGAITGFGQLTMAGTGTTVIATTNSYTGGTLISGGTLRVGNGGTAGSLGTGIIQNDGILDFNRSDALTMANAISGSGSLSQSGTGTTVLTAENNYYGSTTINAGTLQIGGGGATGSIDTTNTIVNNGNLAYNRSGTVTLQPDISGTGTLTQMGPGTLVLPNDKTFTGATIITGGTLQLGNGGVGGGVLSPTIANGGTLAINRADDLNFTPVVSGTGGITHAGPAIVRLLGANTYTGTTLVSGGGLLQLDSEGSYLPAGGALAISNGTVNFTDLDLTIPTLNKPASGNATITANTGKTLTVTGGVTVNQGQLSLETLDAFVFNNASGNINVITAASGGTAIAKLARSSTITAGTVGVGWNGPGGSGASSFATLTLGDTTVIHANSILVGANSAQTGTSTLNIAPTLPASTVTIRNAEGTGRANMTVGLKSGSDYAGGSAAVNFNTAGTTLDAMLGTLTLGTHFDGAGNFNNATSGSFSFGAGTLDATTIVMAAAATVNVKTSNGDLTTNGGTIRTGTLTMVQDSGGAMGTATVNLTGGGSLYATTITGQATANATINLAGGTLHNLTGTDLTVTNVRFALPPTATPAANAETGHTINLGTGTTLAYTFDSSSATPTTSTITVTGALNLAATALTLTDTATTPVALPGGTKFVLANLGGGSLTGTFTGVAEGSSLVAGPNTFIVSYVDSSRITLSIPGGSAYDSWLTSKGITPGATNAGPAEDFDVDGVSNMVEYVLNSNPATGGQNNLPVSTKSGSNLVFTFTRLKEAGTAGFVSSVEYSPTLTGTWTTATAGMIQVTDNGTTETVVATIPVPGDTSKIFARLRVVKP